MNTNYEETRNYLLTNNTIFRKHFEEHRSIHQKIEEIEKNNMLTDADRINIKSLKKQKLFLKDKMEDMIYEHINLKERKNIAF